MPPLPLFMWSALGALTGIPFFVWLWTAARLLKRRLHQPSFHAVEVAQLPLDVKRAIEPWLDRLAHFGFRAVQTGRLDHPDHAEGFRWLLVQEAERSFATLDRIVPLAGGRPRMELRFFTAQPDGTLFVTLDREAVTQPPDYWNLFQRHFREVEEQWIEHNARLPAVAGRVLPPTAKLAELLEADGKARQQALIESGYYVPLKAAPQVLRVRKLRLPELVTPTLIRFLRRTTRPSGPRRDVATPPPQVEGMVESGMPIEEAVERDLQRYRRLSAINGRPLDLLRRWGLLITTVTVMTLLFGRAQPVEIAWMVVALCAFHEFGHWLPMKLFRYRGLNRVFVPFSGDIERARKLHAPAWQQLIVLFGGPLPGLLLGIAVLIRANFAPDVPLRVLDLAGLAVVLNAIHLLPILPLDGGRIVDVLFFRDLPWLRPIFTVLSAGSALAGALALRSRVMRGIAFAFFGGLIWDFRTIGVVRGARKLAFAGELTDENEVLRRAFRGVREEGNEAFIGSEGWHIKIDALLGEVLRRRPRVVTRVLGGVFYLFACGLPVLVVAALLLMPFFGGAGRWIDTKHYEMEFQNGFPRETRVAKDPAAIAVLQEKTVRAVPNGRLPGLSAPGVRRDLTGQLLPEISAPLDKINWDDVAISRRQGILEAPVLAIWLEALCRQMEGASVADRGLEAVTRAEVLLYAVSRLEPVPTLGDRERLWDVEMRTLSVIERESATGRIGRTTLMRIKDRITLLSRDPVPEVDNFLLVSAWADKQRADAAEDATRSGLPEIRFWRDLYPRTHRLKEILTFDPPLTPAAVALARYWKTSRWVGELPPHLDQPVAVSRDDTAFILGFCERQRLMAWRRATTLWALELEVYRQRSGRFPDMSKHSVQRGASVELVRTEEEGPSLKLLDVRDSATRRPPDWLMPRRADARLPVPPLHYQSPLFGSRGIPALSSNK